MTVDQIKQFFDYLGNKVQSGAIQISQFNLAMQRANMQLFDKVYDEFERTQKITDDIQPFLTPLKTLIASDGTFTYPSDYLHISSIRAYYVDKNNVGIPVPIREIKNSEWGDVQQSEVAPPTLRFPAMTQYDTYMEFLPRKSFFIQFDYIREPTPPVWAYTIVNGRAVYDAANSVQLQFNDTNHNDIVMMMASFLGMNIRENDLIQYSEMKEKSGV
jgi:hypothetical protein